MHMKSARLLILLILISPVLLRCTCKKTGGGQRPCPAVPEYKGYTLALGNLTPDDFKRIIQEELNIELKEEEFYVCPCDGNIAFLNHGGITIDGHGPVQVKTGTEAVGLDIEFAKNFVIDTDASNEDSEIAGTLIKTLQQERFQTADSTGINPLIPAGQEASNASGANVVAVFDGGVHESLKDLSFKSILGLEDNSVDRLCKPQIDVPLNSYNRMVGVNHLMEEGTTNIDYTAIWDNSSSQHGIKVTYLLASQRVGQSGANPLRILTMRVLDAHNKGDLFSLMCAMAQARKLGANIFNLSLGYYGPESRMLRDYIKGLESDKIWVVAAAGNSIDRFNDEDAHLPRNRDLTLRSEESKFFPAYFAADMGHVIAVTTVRDGLDSTCNLQNYGKRVVDIGVKGENCGFPFPQVTGQGIQGTSYATPIVSGWLATKNNLNNFVDKEALLSDASVTEPLKSQIKGGKYIKINAN